MLPSCTRWIRPFVLSLVLSAGATANASAAPDSTYVTYDFDKCRQLSKSHDDEQRKCADFQGISVSLEFAEDGSFISFGNKQVDKSSAPYGDDIVYALKDRHAKVEWRGTNDKGNFHPYAAIVRHDVSPSVDGPFRPVLVIFRVEDRAKTCIVSVIDARRSDANLRSRQIADARAHQFECGADSVIRE